MAVPGAVGVSSQAALGAALPVEGAAVQGHLGQAIFGANVQLLLWKNAIITNKADQNRATWCSYTVLIRSVILPLRPYIQKS